MVLILCIQLLSFSTLITFRVDTILFQELIGDFGMCARERLVSLLALRENMIVSRENRYINNVAHQLTSGSCNPGSTI